MSVAQAKLPRRDRLVILAGLLIIAGLGWLYLGFGVAQMPMPANSSARMAVMASEWTAAHASLTLVMWIVMMAAMMLPSATPAVLTYATIVRRIAPAQNCMWSIALFAFGYALVWAIFSFLATLMQWALDRAMLLSQAMASSSAILGASVLILAGVYQWTPLKDLCLEHCRAPLAFIAEHWRPGYIGGLRIGIHHGVYCVGCCWALMLLLFVGGVMNLLWIACIAAFVLLEKLFGVGSRSGRLISGAILVGAGLVLSGRSLLTD